MNNHLSLLLLFVFLIMSSHYLVFEYEDEDSPQACIEYANTSIYAIASLALVWLLYSDFYELKRQNKFIGNAVFLAFAAGYTSLLSGAITYFYRSHRWWGEGGTISMPMVITGTITTTFWILYSREITLLQKGNDVKATLEVKLAMVIVGIAILWDIGYTVYTIFYGEMFKR